MILNHSKDRFVAIHHLYRKKIKIEIWWNLQKTEIYILIQTGNYISSKTETLREHMEHLMATRWQSIFKERMSFLRGNFFLLASSLLIITIESFTRTRYPRAQQNSFSSPLGGGQSSLPRRHSSHPSTSSVYIAAPL